jgi:uncharacterized protein (TIGR02001 family)
MRLAILTFAALLPACPAAATGGNGVDLSANVGVVSDYRFRGLSLSDRNPALQGGVDLEADMGLFAGTWASTIADYEGANVELDLYGGYAGSMAGFSYRLSANAYFYPGGRNVDYMEFRFEAAREVGPVTLGAEMAFVPRQRNIGTANRYFGASASVAVPGLSGLTASARAGREQGFYDGKWDWEFGLAYTRGVLTASLAWIDSNYGGAAEEGRLGRGGLVASLLATF